MDVPTEVSEPQTLEVPKLATITITGSHVSVMLDPSLDGTTDFTSPDLDDSHLHRGKKPGQMTWVPGQVYYDSNDTSSDSIKRLCFLTETLLYWDPDGDGTFDADHVIQVLLSHTDAKNHLQVSLFARPRSSYWARLCTRLTPPAPKRHFVMSLGELKPRYKLWHYLIVLPTMAAFIGITTLELSFAPWLKFSPLTAVTSLWDVNVSLAIAATVSCFLVFFRGGKPAPEGSATMSYYTRGFFNKAATFEEQAFREGAEHWNFLQRVQSCFAFGLVHQANLFYSLSTILPLAIGGAVFMYAYLHVLKHKNSRRAAVLAASVLHRVYNRVALIAVLVMLIQFYVGKFDLYGLICSVCAGTTVAWALMADSNHKNGWSS